MIAKQIAKTNYEMFDIDMLLEIKMRCYALGNYMNKETNIKI